MNYWVCVTRHDNWEVIKKINVWGVEEKWRNQIEQVQPGDHLIIYVTQARKNGEVIPSGIAGVFEAVSKPYKESKRVFKVGRKGSETYPLRVKLKPLKIAGERVDFKKLIQKLEFIKNKQKWTGYVRTAMRKIPEKDGKTIEKVI